ncbi:MAG: hypothetical protein AB7E60_05265 [Sphingobium sp.]
MSGRPKRYFIMALLAPIALALVSGIVLFAWKGPALHARAGLDAAYGARIACSCRFVEGRAMGSCRHDKEPGMWMVALSERPQERAVHAHVPLLAARTARYRPGWGCILDPAG